MSRRGVEIHTLAEWDARTLHAGGLAGWFVQSVDLRDRRADLQRLGPAGAVFLGCRFADDDADHVRDGGALVFPRLPGLPFDPYRSGLYTAEELYGPGPHRLTGSGYPGSLDAVVYAWSRQPRDLGGTLATALHDHSVTDALDDVSPPADRLVGVMGGHAMARGSAAYAGAARLGAALTRAGRTVVTGGGPGAMEAANLGAWLAHRADADLEEACAVLARTPSFRPDVADWAARAFEVRRRWPGGADSLGIPTWFYGHEPPNAFATAVAKYFANAVRKDTLLRRCRGGIVYLPGAAGTVQEIFQAATENYYAAGARSVAPLVLVDVAYWTATLPAWPLLRAEAAGRPMAEALHLVDSVDDVPAALGVGGLSAPRSPGSR